MLDQTVRTHHALIGPIPSMHSIIAAYISLKFKRFSSFISITNPVYAHIYYLLRSGHSQEAIQYASQQDLSSDPQLVTYLSYFVSRGNDPRIRENLLIYWNTHIRPHLDFQGLASNIDPFRVALYKLFGLLLVTRI